MSAVFTVLCILVAGVQLAILALAIWELVTDWTDHHQ